MTIKEIREKFELNRERMNELADTLERENRERTDEETAEFEALKKEKQQLRESLTHFKEEEKMEIKKTLCEEIRETLNRGERYERSIANSTADLQGIDKVGIKVQDIVEPLAEGLILNKVGLPFQTGLKGSFVWPVYEAAEATIAGEGVELADSKITFSQLQATPIRMGVAYPVSREAINQSEGLVEDVIRKSIPASLSKLMNKLMFSTTKINPTCFGPFAEVEATQFAGAVATAKELSALKAKVLATGTNGDKLAWVMTKADEALLEVTPVNEKGIFRPIVEPGSHMLFGYPIYTTEFIGKGNIGIGDFTYQPTGLFGEVTLIVDPYSPARKNVVDFVANVNFATKCIRPECFALGKVAE